MARFTGLLGIAVILIAAWVFSTNRRAIQPRVILWGLGLQFVFAVLVLKTSFGKIFEAIGVGVNAMLNYAEAGSNFVFGPLGIKSGPFGVVFAFQVLPIVIFIASFFAILYYLGGYLFTVLAAFTVICVVLRATDAEDIGGLAGLHQRSPLLAAAMTLSMVSLAGIPPLAGFFG